VTVRVFILNRGGHDYSRAERFGTLVYCSEGLLAKYDIGKMVRILSDAMSDSTAEDYLLLTSLSSLCSVACALFAMKHRRLNLLIFKDGDYVERRVLLDEPATPTNERSYNDGNATESFAEALNKASRTK